MFTTDNLALFIPLWGKFWDTGDGGEVGALAASSQLEAAAIFHSVIPWTIITIDSGPVIRVISA